MVENAMIHLLNKTNLFLSDEPLPFMAGQRTEIDRYWKSVLETNNRLWNGDFYMFSDVTIENQVMSARGHKTDFATFLYWRDHGRHECITHITGTTFPLLADGSLLAIKMASHTANPGKIYFPAGSLDVGDLIDGAFDIKSNLCREFKEEIGLDIQENWLAGPFLASEGENAFHIARRMRIPIEFDQLERDWEVHRANGSDDEVESLVPICNQDDIPLEMPSYATALCRYYFNGQEIEWVGHDK